MMMSPSLPVILYVEDERDDIFFMRAAIRRAAVPSDFRVVENGDEAIAYLGGEKPFDDRTQHPLPSLVLLDLNLPVCSGFEVLAWLRTHDELWHIPVIVFSSSGLAEDRARAQELGAAGYLLKPGSGLAFTDIALQLKQQWLGGSAATAAIDPPESRISHIEPRT